ncbi:MAG: hypothetical protein N3E36_02130 [Sulfolobales archaeon]|nr:hypothetical protein [Sulfolobales archaeon]
MSFTFSLNILPRKEARISIDQELAKKIALLPQIATLSRVKLEYSGSPMSLRDPAGYVIKLGCGECMWYAISAQDVGISWKPYVDFRRIRNLLANMGLVKEGGGDILVNPLPMEVIAPFDGGIVKLKPFSTKTVTNYVEREFTQNEIAVSGFKLKLTNNGLLIYNVDIGFTSDAAASVKRVTTIGNNLKIYMSDGSEIMLSTTYSAMHLDLVSDYSFNTRWLNAIISALTPYFIASTHLDLNEEHCLTNALLILKNTLSIGIVNADMKKIYLHRGQMTLPPGRYFITYSIGQALDVLNNVLLLLSSEGALLKNCSKVVDFEELFVLFPKSILIGDYVVSEDYLGIVLFNPSNLALKTTLTSFFEFEKAVAYTARNTEGISLRLEKPNIVSLTILPRNIIVLEASFRNLGPEVVKYRSMWRKVGRGEFRELIK